jgi:hypothetical protein
MYVWTRKEIAEAFGVSLATPTCWIRNWGPETEHPFPEPIARLHKLPQPSGRPQLVFDPGAVQVWWAGLPEAKHRRMSQAQTGVKRPRKGAQPVGLSVSIQELEDSTASLVATLKELEAKRLGVHRG